MRFAVEHDVLSSAVTFAARVVPSRTVRPVLSSLLLAADENRLSMTASDLETSAVCSIPAQVDEPGRVALPIKYISELLRRVPGGRLGWSASGNGTTTEISWEKSRFTVHGFDPAEFPPVTSFGTDADVMLPSATLRNAIQGSIFAAAEGETARPLLSGVELRFAAGNVFALSTDGFQAASFASSAGAPRPDGDGVVVPATALAAVNRLLDDPQQMCEVAVRNNQILFRVGDRYLVTRLLEGRFFSVLDLVPKSFSTVLDAEREVLLGACARVALITDNEPPHTIVLEMREGALRLTAASPEVGQAEEEVPAEVTGPAVRVGFNARQLQDGLRHLDGVYVRIELSGAKTLARFTDPRNACLQFLQMPLDMRDAD